MGISKFFRSDENEKKSSVFDILTQDQKSDMACDLVEIYRFVRRWKSYFPEEKFEQLLSELSETGRKVMAKTTMAALQDDVESLNIGDLIPEALKDVVNEAKKMINGS